MGDITYWGHPSFGEQGGSYWKVDPTDVEFITAGEWDVTFVRNSQIVDIMDREALLKTDWLIFGTTGWIMILRGLPRCCDKCKQEYLPALKFSDANPDTVTDSKGYLDGYQTGLTWTKNYVPGGPFVMSPRANESLKNQGIAQQSLDNYRDWHRGFGDGIKKQDALKFVENPVVDKP